MTVAPSGLAMQPIGEAAPVAEGVWQLKLPVPFPLRFVSVYLVGGNAGWTLVDVGYEYQPARVAWESGATTAGFDLAQDVVRIVVTHFHPDHIGAARWLGEKTGAPVCMMEREILFARKLWGSSDVRPFVEYLIRYGMPLAAAGSTAAVMRYPLPLPEEMVPIRPGEELTLGEGAVRVIHVPGHADNQIVLHDETRGILFAADHLLLGITPNIGLWPESEPHPLARYLESLESMRGLGADLVLPGHGPVFHDLDGRIGELMFHHEERLETMQRDLRPSEDPVRGFADRVPRHPDRAPAVFRARRDAGAPGSPRLPGPGTADRERGRHLPGLIVPAHFSRPATCRLTG